MTFISYAQNFEDVMLWRALKHISAGFYIDVGANDPVEFSVTKAFYDRGWNGINIEPVEQWINRLSNDRPRDINIQAAALDRIGEATLYLFKDTGLSTINAKTALQYTKSGFGKENPTIVRTLTLNEVCAGNNVKEIHFLKIDVEGAEEKVLDGISLQKYRPWILVIEATAPFSNADLSQQWENKILNCGYQVGYFDGLNKFYIANEHSELLGAFKCPPNVIDDFVTSKRIVLENALHLANEQITAKDKEIQQAHQSISEISARTGRLNDLLRRKNDTILASERNNIELSTENARLKNAVEQNHKIAEEWKKRATTLALEAKKLGQRIVEQLDTINVLEQQQSTLNTAFEALNRKINEMKQSAKMLELTLNRIKTRTRILRKHIGEKNEKIKGLITRNTELQDIITLRDISVKELRGAIDYYTNESKALKNRLSSAEVELAAIKQSYLWKIAFPIILGNQLLAKSILKLSNTVKTFGFNTLELLKSASRSVGEIGRENGPLGNWKTNNILENHIKTARPGSIRGYQLNDSDRLVLLYVEHTAHFDRTTGVQRVCHNIAPHLAACGEVLVLVKLDQETLNFSPLSPEDRATFFAESGLPDEEKHDPLYDSATLQSVLSELRSHPRKHWLIVPEVTYHTMHPNPPTARLIKICRDLDLKVGFIFYDNIPLLSKDASENAQKHRDYLSTIALADVIWPISEYSKNGLIDYYRRHENLNNDEMPAILVNSLPSEMSTRREYGSNHNECKEILCVGTIDERKNQLTLIQAFNDFCRDFPDLDLKLNVVGMVRDSYRSTIESAANHNPKVQFFFNATNSDISQFFANCHFTVFPSLEEGYGLPIVESLWHLRPCICANFGSMRELQLDGGCIGIDTRSVSEIKSALRALILDQRLYERKVEEILTRPVKTWFEYANGFATDMSREQFGPKYTGLIYYWIDATVAANGNTGIQRVARQLAKHLIEQGHKLVPIKWDSEINSIAYASYDELEYLARWNGPAINSWTHTTRLDPDGEEATYLMVDLPLNRSIRIQNRVIDHFKHLDVRCFAIFYDAIPYKLASIYPPEFTQAHIEYMEMLDRMDCILAISRTSAKDLVSFLDSGQCRALALERRITPIALPSSFPELRCRSIFSEEVDKYLCQILCVGTVEPRKNHKAIIRAFLLAQNISRRRLKLVIAGGDESFDKELPDEIQRLVDSSIDIDWIRSPTDQTLLDLYQQSEFTVFASEEEGFGLPIVESLWLNVPCICSSSGQPGELAKHGGCLSVNVNNTRQFANAIFELANNRDLADQLRNEIRNRYFATWSDYASEISSSIRRNLPLYGSSLPKLGGSSCRELGSESFYEFIGRPIISVCITTYNRSEWLSINLEYLVLVTAGLGGKIEIVVCDNHSTDETREIIARFEHEPNVRFFRNSANIGMLNNLSETVSHAMGDYVWLIGDDDLIHEGALETLIEIIEDRSPDLINVNYAYSASAESPKLSSLEEYFANSTIICDAGGSLSGAVKEISAFNENFYTAIYTFVVKRKLAQRIFMQDTSGPPFADLKSCVPSSVFILSRLLQSSGCWVNDPLVTINMNVSWGKFIPIWILERIPEVYDLAELHGVRQEHVDLWRKHTLKSTLHYFEVLYSADDPGIYASFDILKFVRRYRHLSEFRELWAQFEHIYIRAQRNKHVLATASLETLRGSIK